MGKLSKHRRRQRRALRSRGRIRRQGKMRLSVYRSANHIYAQIIADHRGHTLVSSSTLDSEIRNQVNYGGNVEAAKLIGAIIAKRAVQAGIQEVAFDRSGYKYHGRVRALAEAARENGLQF